MNAKTVLRVCALAAPTLLFASNAAHAVVTSASSEGYGAQVSLDVLPPLVSINLGPLPAGVSGTAPPNYSESDTNLGINASIALTASASSGIISATADGQTGAGGFADATGTIDGVDLTLIPGLIPLITPDTLSLTADQIGSHTNLTEFTSLQDSIFNNLVIDILGTTAVVLADPAPNTVVDAGGVLAALGITLTLNEQLNLGGLLITNALHLVANPLGLNVLTADIILGHSQAQLLALAVPGPGGAAILVLLGAAILGIGWVARGRKASGVLPASA